MKKEYRHVGVCPIIVEGFGRVNPGTPSFICEMDAYWEKSFTEGGAIVVLREVPDETPDSEPSRPKPRPGGRTNPADVMPWPGRDEDGNLTMDGKLYVAPDAKAKAKKEK